MERAILPNPPGGAAGGGRESLVLLTMPVAVRPVVLRRAASRRARVLPNRKAHSSNFRVRSLPCLLRRGCAMVASTRQLWFSMPPSPAPRTRNGLFSSAHTPTRCWGCAAVATVGVGALAAVHGNLAVAHLRLGEAQEAKRQAEIALGENPQHGEAMKTLGLLAYRAGRSDEASDWLQRALEQNPSIPEARLALAELDDAAGRHAAARKRYRDLLLRFQEARTRDPHWRWRRLFYPQDVDTEVELKRRIGAR